MGRAKGQRVGGRGRALQRRDARARIVAGTGLTVGVAVGAGASAEAAEFTVTSSADDGGGPATTLREAILAADNGGGDDRILFAASVTGTIVLNGTELPTIDEPLEIQGPGPGKLTISANHASRIFRINTPGAEPVTIAGLRLRGGRPAMGGGGAIRHYDASLTVSNAEITGNSTIAGNSGAGIRSTYGSLTVRDSTISGNKPTGAGGGISTYGGGSSTMNILIERSTISGNSAGFGGGVSNYTYGTATLTIRDSTISGNTATSGQGGGGLVTYRGSSRSIVNTIVGNNTAPNSPDVLTFPGDPLSASFSLIENPSGATITGAPNITGTDPKLGPLADNGGETATHALLGGSPALDKGKAAGSDQRGAARPFNHPGKPAAPGGNSADIGAYERVLCGGVAVNRIGTSGRDKLRGGGGRDGLLGLAGRDTLKGLGGGDGLCGGKGADRLLGGPGRDKLLGGPGRDRLRGGPGRDRLRGGPGRDRQRQ